MACNTISMWPSRSLLCLPIVSHPLVILQHWLFLKAPHFSTPGLQLFSNTPLPTPICGHFTQFSKAQANSTYLMKIPLILLPHNPCLPPLELNVSLRADNISLHISFLHLTIIFEISGFGVQAYLHPLTVHP